MSYANLICYVQFIWYFIWDVALDFLAFLYSSPFDWWMLNIYLYNCEPTYVIIWELTTTVPSDGLPLFALSSSLAFSLPSFLSLGGNMLPWIRVIIEGKRWCLVAKAISGLWSFDSTRFFQKEKWSLFAFFNRTSLWVVNQRFHVAMFRRG